MRAFSQDTAGHRAGASASAAHLTPTPPPSPEGHTDLSRARGGLILQLAEMVTRGSGASLAPSKEAGRRAAEGPALRGAQGGPLPAFSRRK